MKGESFTLRNISRCSFDFTFKIIRIILIRFKLNVKSAVRNNLSYYRSGNTTMCGEIDMGNFHPFLFMCMCVTEILNTLTLCWICKSCQKFLHQLIRYSTLHGNVNIHKNNYTDRVSFCIFIFRIFWMKNT